MPSRPCPAGLGRAKMHERLERARGGRRRRQARRRRAGPRRAARARSAARGSPPRMLCRVAVEWIGCSGTVPRRGLYATRHTARIAPAQRIGSAPDLPDAPHAPFPSSRRPSFRGVRRPRPLDIAPYDFAAAVRLGRDSASAVLAQVLVRRGTATGRGASGSWPPTRRTHSTRSAASRRRVVILGHVERGSRIIVHGDYDVDGVCSTAVLVRALRALGAHVDWYLPSRVDDGYGLAPDGREARRARVRPADHRRLRDHGRGRGRGRAAAGIDVVVTDHHRRAPTARCPTPRSCTRGSRLPLRGPVRGRRCLQARPRAARGGGGGRGRRRRGPRPRRARDGRRRRAAHGREPPPRPRRAAQAAGTRKPGLRALMGVARADPACSTRARSASASPRGSTPPAGSTAPTPPSSCC